MPLNTDGQWLGTTPFNIASPTIHDTAGHLFVDARGLFVLHAFLLHSGKVLCFCGHVEGMNYAPLCYLFDPANPTGLMAPKTFPAGADPFCGHYVQIPDGRVLAVGGSQMDVGAVDNTLPDPSTTPGYVYRGSTGEKIIAMFDPAPGVEDWFPSNAGGVANQLKQGRWYPTAVTLPDGRVAVFSGRRELNTAGNPPAGVSADLIADMVEIISPATAGDWGSSNWSSQELTGATKKLPIYPGMHLAPNGRIYFVHTNWGQEIASPDTASLLIGSGVTSATWTNYAGLQPPHPRREEGSSVLLPPAQDGKIFIVGGSKALDSLGRGILDRAIPRVPGDPPFGPSGFDHIADPADGTAADVLDTSVDPPTWSSVGPSNHPRINGHCVLLPDATVLICGGHDNYKWNARPPAPHGTTPSLTAEIYTPGSPGSFRDVAVMNDPRMYHSVALLLPDGRVFTAGGADLGSPGAPRLEPVPPYPADWNTREIGGAALNVKTFELYEPPYMHNGTRPLLDDVLRNGTSTQRIEYGQTFTVKTAQAADIAKVVLMRPGTPTHHTDTEQRYVPLTFTVGSGELTVTAINDSKIAPPGFYMLWIVDNHVPPRPCAMAKFIQLLPATGNTGGTSCFVATAAYGSADHPSVHYLQNLRQQIRQGSRAGNCFIRFVNAIYVSFSPQLAQKISGHAAARQAIREIIVRPIVAIIKKSERLSQRMHPQPLQHPLLMTLFILEALLGFISLPAVVLLVLGRIKRLQWFKRQHSPDRRHHSPDREE